MTAAAQHRAARRYGLAWCAELCDWLIRLGAWRASAGLTDERGRAKRRRDLLEVLAYLRATRPERN